MQLDFFFELVGNSEDPAGNPQPYFRQTRNTLRKPAALRYFAWKNFVVNKFLAKLKGEQEQWAAKNMLDFGKPIVIPDGHYAYQKTWIWVANNAHADADNIHKGILDALYVNDKKVLEGHYKLHLHPSENKLERVGYVQVEIKILPNEK